MIAVPYVHTHLRDETVRAVQAQWRDPIFYELEPDDPYAYADLLRRLWRFPCDLVIVEHDMVPPDHALQDLHECRAMWCTYPYPHGGATLTEGLGVARFNPLLRMRALQLVDFALARQDGRAWTRQGLTYLPADSTEATIDRYGRYACMRHDVQLPRGPDGGPRWPSTVPWSICDTYLARQLRALGVGPHVHQPAALHLHGG